MSARPYDKDEIARRGKELYERRVREDVEAEGANEGRLLAIDVESGDYTRSQTTCMGLARGCAAGGPPPEARRSGPPDARQPAGRAPEGDLPARRALSGEARTGTRPVPMFGSVAADGGEPLLPLVLLGGAKNGTGRFPGRLDHDQHFAAHKDIPVVKAARLSASFPYVSPAARAAGIGGQSRT